MSVKVLLIDDHAVVREVLREALEQSGDILVVAEAGDGAEGIRLALDLCPDIVIMDIEMPGLGGVEATRRLKAECPEIKVLALTMYTGRRVVNEMLKAGADGYLHKQCSLTDLVMGVRQVAEGMTVLSPRIAALVVDGFLNSRGGMAGAPAASILSPREGEVLRLIAEGKTIQEVATILGVSVSTVETYKRKLKDKLNIDSIAGLIKFAIREGLTTLTPK